MEAVVNAQVSVYPLRQVHLGPAVEAVRSTLEACGFHPEVGAMSTNIRGAAEKVFAALGAAFERVASEGEVVMTIAVSNACPAPIA